MEQCSIWWPPCEASLGHIMAHKGVSFHRTPSWIRRNEIIVGHSSIAFGQYFVRWSFRMCDLETCPACRRPLYHAVSYMGRRCEMESSAMYVWSITPVDGSLLKCRTLVESPTCIITFGQYCQIAKFMARWDYYCCCCCCSWRAIRRGRLDEVTR